MYFSLLVFGSLVGLFSLNIATNDEYDEYCPDLSEYQCSNDSDAIMGVTSDGACECSGDTGCKQSTCHVNGCDECDIENGYFKYDYDYTCLQCQEVFGPYCDHCTDFTGCQQCIGGYIRIQDSEISECDLHICVPPSNNTDELDTTTTTTTITPSDDDDDDNTGDDDDDDDDDTPIVTNECIEYIEIIEIDDESLSLYQGKYYKNGELSSDDVFPIFEHESGIAHIGIEANYIFIEDIDRNNPDNNGIILYYPVPLAYWSENDNPLGITEDTPSTSQWDSIMEESIDLTIIYQDCGIPFDYTNDCTKDCLYLANVYTDLADGEPDGDWEFPFGIYCFIGYYDDNVSPVFEYEGSDASMEIIFQKDSIVLFESSGGNSGDTRDESKTINVDSCNSFLTIFDDNTIDFENDGVSYEVEINNVIIFDCIDSEPFDCDGGSNGVIITNQAFNSFNLNIFITILLLQLGLIIY